LKGSSNPAGVAARQIRGDDRFIHLRHSPLIARNEHRRPFFGTGRSEEGGAGYGESDWPCRSRQRPRFRPIAVATSNFAALVGSRPERSPQLLMHGRLDCDADVLVDQFAQRDGLKLLRSRGFPDTFAHGAFLRWPPARAAGCSCTSPTGRMRHLFFPQASGHDHAVQDKSRWTALS
jgi:hypothetical protein